MFCVDGGSWVVPGGWGVLVPGGWRDPGLFRVDGGPGPGWMGGPGPGRMGGPGIK